MWGLPLSADNRKIWAIAGPAILANISAPLIALIDTWAIGHLPGAHYLAAVGIAGTIFTFILWAFGFLRMGTTGLIAQANGADDHEALTIISARAIMIGLVIGVLMMLLAEPLVVFGMTKMDSPPETHDLIRQYASIRQYSMPASLTFYALNGILIGLAATKSALKLHLFLNISNGLLNILFVIVMGMGVPGVALGTVLAEWLALIIGFYLLAKHMTLGPLVRAFVAARTWRLAAFLRFLGLNGFIFARTLLLMSAWTLILQRSALIGSEAVAASHMMNQFTLLISLGLDGIAYAAEALAGAAYGAKDRAKFRHWSILTTKWALGMAILYSLVFWLAGDALVGLLTEVDSVISTTQSLTPIIIILPIIAVWSFQFDGIFIGATDAKAMFSTMTIAFMVFYAALTYFPMHYQLFGVWLAMLCFLATRGITQALWYPYLEKRLK